MAPCYSKTWATTTVYYYGGLPNSGKTYEVFDLLCQNGGAFASPLVGLAEEVSIKLREKLLNRDGRPVSLRTGQRTYYVKSPWIVVGTYECLRNEDYVGLTLVIDEVEFSITDRGCAIDRLLQSIGTAGAPKDLVLIGPGEEGAIRAFESHLNQALIIKTFKPLSTPDFLEEPLTIEALEPHDCLCVLGFQDLREVSRRVYRQRPDLAVLYLTGADSVTSRRKLRAYDRWRLGHLTIATTAASHGMNWAFKRMIFDIEVDFDQLDPWTRRVLYQMAHRVARGTSRGEFGATTARGVAVLRRVRERDFGEFKICLDADVYKERDLLQNAVMARENCLRANSTGDDGPLLDLVQRAIDDFDSQRDGDGLDQSLPGALEEHMETGGAEISDSDLRLLRQASSLIVAKRAQKIAEGLLAARWPGNQTCTRIVMDECPAQDRSTLFGG